MTITPRYGQNTISILSNAKMQDMGDYVLIPAVIAVEGVYQGINGLWGFRSSDEVKKMAPLCNSLRVVLGSHPDMTDPYAHVVADLQGTTHPFLGVTQDAIAKYSDKYHKWRVHANLRIDKVDRNGNDQSSVIQRMANKDLEELSIGYYFKPLESPGSYEGQPYDYLETEINPYHVAALDGVPAAARPPLVGVGANQGGQNMEGQNVPPTGGPDIPPALVKGKPEPISAGDLSIDTLAGCNSQVKAVITERDDLKTQIKELQAKINSLEEEKKGSEKVKAELEAIKKAERDKKVAALKEKMGENQFGKVYPEKSIEDVTDAELDRTISLIDAATPPEEPVEGQTEGVSAEGNAAKAQGSKTSMVLNFKGGQNGQGHVSDEPDYNRNRTVPILTTDPATGKPYGSK